MADYLVIVESPTKAKIIKKFLEKSHEVVSSMGHVRDLPVHKLGIDIENHFTPEYVIIKGKEKIVDEIKKLITKTSKVYLAMDGDREGEAIGWHLTGALDIDPGSIEIDRIVFHEITEEAIRDALENPRKIDMNLVNAQQARRLLDRIVGYKISPLLAKKIRKGLSAGRVQSVGLKLIVNREKARNEFKTKKYYLVEGLIEKESKEMKAELWGKDDVKFKKFHLDSKKKADSIIKACKDESVIITKIDEKQKKRKPSAPFITSTLQQDSYNRLRFSPEKTMRVAQQLYEGIDLPDGSSAGLITYMRTDSVKSANSAINNVRKYISDNLGADYMPSKPNNYRSRKTAQEAHECIRPTDVFRLPDDLSRCLSGDQYKLYKLVWERFIASQMKSAVIDAVAVDLKCRDYNYRVNGQSISFDGYMKVWPTNIMENTLPELKVGEGFNWKKLEGTEHETKPPARFTPATLVSELEKNGIGRPSTYATILATLFKRKYVVYENGSLVPQEIGFVVVEALEEYFYGVMDNEFTARMENNLDEVAEGKMSCEEMLNEFFVNFKDHYDKALENMKKIKDEEIGKKCPKCEAPMVIRWGRNGKFIACSAYPKCKQTFNLDENGEIAKEEKTDMKCSLCGSEMIIKMGRFGKFLACSSYPECKKTCALDEKGELLQIPLGYERCPQCGKDTVIRVSKKGKFLACTGYPKCRFAKGLKELEKKNG
ncbi:type I DNA topoisomerase [Elusimicrobiota bacterium]